MLALYGLATVFTGTTAYLIWKNSWCIYPIINYIYNSTKTQSNNAIFQTMENNRTNLVIHYTQRNKEKTFVFPFDRSEVIHMSALKVSLIYDDNVIIDITQEPGTPYTCCAKDFGAKMISVVNTENGCFFNYENKRPMYVSELKFTE